MKFHIKLTLRLLADHRPPKMRLECLSSYKLYGNVMSLQHVSLSGSQRDAILISFREAKLSVVQHDPDTFALKTLSLHYFEEEDIKVRQRLLNTHKANTNPNFRVAGQDITIFLWFVQTPITDVLLCQYTAENWWFYLSEKTAVWTRQKSKM